MESKIFTIAGFIFGFLPLEGLSQINWPLPTFTQQHQITGTIGEYRNTDRFHQGTDMVNGVDYNVYAVEGGTITVDPSGGVNKKLTVVGSRTLLYVHTQAVPGIASGMTVSAGQLIGTMVTQPAIHLHLQQDGNNLLSSDLFPYTDSGTPQINGYGIYQNGLLKTTSTTQYTTNVNIGGINYLKIYNKIDIMANVSDPGVNTDGTANFGNKLAPYQTSYEILDKSSISVAGPFQYMKFENYPSNTKVTYAFASGTTQSIFKYIITNNPFSSPNDRYWNTGIRTGLTETWPNNTTLDAPYPGEAKYPDDKYTIKITCRDRDFDVTYNTVTQNAAVLVDNFKPYIEKVDIIAGGTTFYSAYWTWDGSSLGFHPSNGFIGGTLPATVRLYASEPLKSASIAISGLGIATTAMTVVLGSNNKQWEYTISTVTLSTAVETSYQLTFSGKDYANNLFEINPSNIPIHQLDGSWLPGPNSGNDNNYIFSFCPKPYDLHILGITDTTVTLDWTSPAADSYNWKILSAIQCPSYCYYYAHTYKPAYWFNLLPAETYTYTISSNCGTAVSLDSDPLTFTTPVMRYSFLTYDHPEISSLENSKKKNNLIVFPNPSNGSRITIDNIQVNDKILITDTNGKDVFSEISNANGVYEIKFPYQLPSGIYFLKVFNKSATYNEKFVVQ